MAGYAGEVVACIAAYLCFVIPAVLALLCVHRFVRLPHEVFRKLLHAVAFLSAPVVMHAAASWQVAVGTLLVFGALVWPLLFGAERLEGYAELFVQRRPHEVRRSMLLLFWGNAAVVAWCWGLCGHPERAVAAILMWGLGDATAALVGKRWGRHHVALPLADHRKTWEGTLGMCVVSAAVGCALLGLQPAVLLAAVVGAYVELVTHGGYDTLTVPVALALVLLLGLG